MTDLDPTHHRCAEIDPDPDRCHPRQPPPCGAQAVNRYDGDWLCQRHADLRIERNRQHIANAKAHIPTPARSRP